MNGFYRATEKLYEILETDPDVNTITKGDPSEIDVENTTIFPLVHITPIPSRFNTRVQVFSFDIMALNQRETFKEPTLNKFTKNDNFDDNLNAMWYVLFQLFLKIKEFGDDFNILNEPTPEPVIFSRKNLVDGWAIQLDIELPIEEIGAC